MAVAKCCQRTLCVLLAITVGLQALQLHKDDATDDAVPPSGNRTKPRMLISEGCDGSRSIIRHAHFLMRAHGIKTPWKKFYSLHGPENNSVEVGNVFLGGKHVKDVDVASQDSKKGGYDAQVEEDMQDEGDGAAVVLQTRNHTEMPQDIGSEMSKMFEYYAAENRSLVFRASIGEAQQSKLVFEMGSLVASISRQNKVDELVCMVKDCFDNKDLGYPVLNGEKSDLCWKHRSQNPANYTAFVKPGSFLKNLEVLSNKTAATKRHLVQMGFSGSSLDLKSEDLLDFEWDTEAVGRAVSSWTTLLKAWGVRANSTEVKSYIKHHSGNRTAPSHHENTIFNFEDVKKSVEGHGRFSWMLRE